MATFPTVDFTQYQWVVNDTDYLTKWNGMQSAITALQDDINTFGGEVEQDLAGAIQAVETIRDDEVIPAKNTAVQAASDASGYRDETQQLRDETQAIAVGDVAITDLQPGTLAAPKDYVSVDSEGALIRRNLAADIAEQLGAGTESASLRTYQLKATPTTGSVTVDQTVQLIYPITLSGSGDSVSLPSLAGVPSGYGFVAVLHIDTTAGGSITWDADIEWDEDAPPELAPTFMRVLLTWDGVRWTGTVGVSR